MDLRKLKKLIDLVQESGIAELEITEGEEKVRIVSGGAVSVTPRRAVMRRCRRGARAGGARGRRRPGAPQSRAAGRRATSSRRRWSAPSTARRRPDAKPFVEVGQAVKAATRSASSRR